MTDVSGQKVSIQSCKTEKGLGIHIDQQLTFSTHIKEAITKSNWILGKVRRPYQNLDAEVMMYIYKGLIRPTLAYGVVVWAPKLQKDIEAILIEGVQRRATRLIPSMKQSAI